MKASLSDATLDSTLNSLGDAKLSHILSIMSSANSPSIRFAIDHPDSVRGVDSELLQALRGSDASVGELVEALGVTATAVRQRLDRMLLGGLVQRQKVVIGRGRPSFRYALTIEGHRHAGADVSELADVMWREILSLRDGRMRRRLLTSIARQLGQRYSEKMKAMGTDVDPTLEQRMRFLSALFVGNHIPSDVHTTVNARPSSRRESVSSNLPILDIAACPYPTLRDHPDDRTMCRMEEEMISQALGAPVHLTSCRLDGDQCCQFTPAPVSSP